MAYPVANAIFLWYTSVTKQTVHIPFLSGTDQPLAAARRSGMEQRKGEKDHGNADETRP